MFLEYLEQIREVFVFCMHLRTFLMADSLKSIREALVLSSLKSARDVVHFSGSSEHHYKGILNVRSFKEVSEVCSERCLCCKII